MIIGIDASSIIAEYKTGIENTAFQIIFHMAKQNHDHELILFSPKPIDDRIKRLPRVSVRVSSPAKFWHALRLPLELVQSKPDVFFTPSYMVPRLPHIKSIAIVHDMAYRHYPEAYSPIERKLQEYSASRNANFAKFLVFVSESTKNDFLRLHHFPAKNTAVVPLGCDTDRFNTTKKKLPENIRQPYVLFVGRLEERKNVKRIIEAFILFKKKSGANHRLLLAGKPGYGFGLINDIINSCGKIMDDITLMGYVPDEQLPALYSNAQALLFPTLYEGFGLPVLEAFCSGTPVVTSNTSSLPEIAGDAALLVDPMSVLEIADAIGKVTSDTNLSQSLRQKGIARAKQFSWAISAERLLSIMEEAK